MSYLEKERDRTWSAVKIGAVLDDHLFVVIYILITFSFTKINSPPLSRYYPSAHPPFVMRGFTGK